jgi:uncharacterized protein (TIGR03437 family)
MTSIPADGSFAPRNPPFPLLTLPIVVTFDAQPAEVLYAGAAPALVSGVFQINARLPNLPPGQHDVVVFVNQAESNQFGQSRISTR